MTFNEVRTQYNISLDNYEKAEKLFEKENALGMSCSIEEIMSNFEKRKAYLKPFSNELRNLYIKLIELTPEDEFILEDYPEYGDFINLNSFKESCSDKMFIDYDGFGRLCYNNKMTQFEIKPSMIIDLKGNPFSRYNGLIWFNR